MPEAISSLMTIRQVAIVAADISTFDMASGTSVGKTRGTRSTGCDLLLAWASLSGVPSGAGRFTAEPEVSMCSTPTNFRNPFSKSLVKSCHPAFLSFASATVVAVLHFS